MLKLNKLILNNFMCVEHAELDFNDGVNLIVGNNGQGKSTVLQAVALCLLEDKRSDRYQEFIMLGKETCQVELSAEVKGNPIDKSKGGIGIVPFVYKDAYNYYYSLFVAQSQNENKNLQQITSKIKEIIIKPPKVKKKIRFFDLGEDEEVDDE